MENFKKLRLKFSRWNMTEAKRSSRYKAFKAALTPHIIFTLLHFWLKHASSCSLTTSVKQSLWNTIHLKAFLWSGNLSSRLVCQSQCHIYLFSAGNSVDHPVFSFSTKWNSTLTHSKLNRKENPTSICTITSQNFSFLMTRLVLIMCAILCELKQKFQLRTELHTTDRHAALKYVLYYKSRTFSLCAGSN